jgi:hypothetical protein
MTLEELPLAEIVFHDPDLEIIEDCRERDGYVLIKCPNDDGTDDHALHVCNPWDGLPAMAYCLSEKCRGVTTAEMLGRIGVGPVQDKLH